MRTLAKEVPDSNRGVTQDEVAPHHESAPTRAHAGSAGSVSAHPDNAHDYWARIAARNRLHEQQAAEADRPETAAEYATAAERAEQMAHELADCMDLPMPSIEALYAFIRDEYLHSRFEGRNPTTPGYSDLIVRSYHDDLRLQGAGLIGHFESRRGKVVYFDRSLRILNPDAPPTAIKYRGGSLSAPMAGIW